MKVAVESVGSFQRKLSITFPANKVKSELDTAFKRMARRARLPGFRPGKVPRKVIEARFGADIRNDVANDLIQRGYRDAVASESLEPVGQPNLDETGEVGASKDFSFTVVVDVRPSVELTKATGVDVVYPKVEVAEEEIDAAVARKLEGEANAVEVDDRPVESGDMVMAEIEVKDGDEVVHTAPGSMVRTDSDPYYTGMEDFLVGMAKGDSKEGTVSFGADCRTEELAGRELSVTAKVLSILANQVPELTDELAEKLGYEGGALGMREALKAPIQAQREELARNQARANLLEVLIAENPFDVPDGMIDTSLQMLMQELRLQQAYLGRDPRSLSFSDAQIADLRLRAAFAAKAGLILEAVSEKEGITITDEDIEKKYQDLADERGQSLEAVRGYFGKPEQLEELKDRMLEEKTLDWLLERANLVDPPAAQEAEAAPAADEEPAPKKAAPKKAAPKAEAAPEPAAEEPAADVDLSFLKGAVGKVKEALETGDHDAHLQAILEAEENGKARKGALAAIKKRIETVG
jgi:trigger factor